ncbi:MAG: hypothetical protein OXG70_04900 [Cyanobacteria bacterium MAG IRC1_bin_28]|nr:hypothetical protein [Cyanobacteria bacterium MAG IRC3_bin_20]MCY3654356.1 hypothetical protein [Cyanobacteria bacterium MAG IRC1_bin_28]MDE0648249.1 hypothetical protein [Cyanobacteria bacterium MAG IRC4_bin_6]
MAAGYRVRMPVFLSCGVAGRAVTAATVNNGRRLSLVFTARRG